MLSELKQAVDRIRKLADSVRVAPSDDDPSQRLWALDAKDALTEIFKIAEEILS